MKGAVKSRNLPRIMVAPGSRIMGNEQFANVPGEKRDDDEEGERRKALSALSHHRKPPIILRDRLVAGPTSLPIPFTGQAGDLPHQVQHINPVC